MWGFPSAKRRGRNRAPGGVSWCLDSCSLSGLLWRRVVLSIALIEGMASWSPRDTYVGTNIRIFRLHTSLMFSGHILSFGGLHFGPFMFSWENFPFPLCLSLLPPQCLSAPSLSGWQAGAVLIPSCLGAGPLTCATSWSDSPPSTTFLFPLKLCKQSTNTKLVVAF